MNLVRFLTDILFPRQCVACGKSVACETICEPCLHTIPLSQTLFCALCKARLPGGRKVCHKNAPYILGAAASYKNPALKELVRQLKFKGVRDAADPIAELIAQYLTECRVSWAGFLIIPLPLSKKRERERGFNQAEEIARRVSLHIALPFIRGALVRIGHSKPQTETKTVAERRLNVRDCFAIEKPECIAGKKILLLDDVTTSGATLHEAAQVLRSAGARTIVAVVAAQA